MCCHETPNDRPRSNLGHRCQAEKEKESSKESSRERRVLSRVTSDLDRIRVNGAKQRKKCVVNDNQ